MKRATFAGWMVALLVPACLVACASRPIEVYEYVLVAAATAAPSGNATRELAIGVGPVVVPRYLQRSGIVTRVGANALRASDTHRWGEDLDRGLARVVADDLAILVPATQVRTFPWRDSAPMDYRVSIDVQRFEPTADGTVVLEARWAVHREDEATAVIRRSARIVEEVGSSDYAAAVGAMSRAAARLSQEIAAAIRADAAMAAGD
jgi:uncharacterized lipoprotein YmbA